MPDLPIDTSPEASGSAPASDAGAAASGEIDPELDRLPSAPPRRRGPIAALAVIAIGLLLLFHLAPDLRYASSQQLPAELGQAGSIRFEASGASSPLADNTLVAVSGLPDYRNALLFEPKGDSYRRSFYRMLGTSSRLWIRAEQTSTRREISERIVGRLRRFDALPYADQVRDYYAKLKVTRQLDLAPFQRRSRGEIDASFLGALLDRSGERVAGLDPARAAATVVVDFPDELLVSLSRERFAVEEDARREVARLGVPVGPGQERADKTGFEYAVRVEPGRRDALLAVVEQRDFSVRVRRERYLTPLSELAQTFPGGAGLPLRIAEGAPPFYDVVGDRLVPTPGIAPTAPPPSAGFVAKGVFRIVPWERVDSIQIDAPVEIPHDAWVLVEADLPSDYGWAKALAVLLLLFVAFNGWLLTRSLRGR